MKRKYFALIFIIAILLLSTIAAAGFWQDVTGMFSFSFSKIFKKQTAQSTIPLQVEKKAEICKVYIDGKCTTELQPKLNIELQKSAKLYVLESKKSKPIDGKTIKSTKTERILTRNVKIGTKETAVKVPVVNLCIGSKCKDYGIDETVKINDAIYNLALVKDKINLIPQGIPLVPPHEEDPSKIELPPLSPMPLEPRIRLPPLSPMTFSPRLFKIGFIVDRDTVPLPTASRDEIQEAIRIANNKLRLRSTNIQFELNDIVEVNMGPFSSDAELSPPLPSYMDNYYFEHAFSPPNGIVILRENPSASSNGGYGGFIASSLAGYGFCNNFLSPRLGNSFIYGSVIDWDHMYAACGYDETYDETNGFDGNHISDVSIDGQCRGTPGTPCVIHNGYYMCNNIDFENEEYARSRLDFVANTIIHEYLHSFHEFSSTSFHYNSPDCPRLDSNLAVSYSSMCPVVWENFANSWHSCGNIAYSDSCEPSIDRCSEGTICESWSADVSNYRCSCLNNEVCQYGRVCTGGRCKTPAGGECDTRRADLCISGHCIVRSGERFKGNCE